MSLELDQVKGIDIETKDLVFGFIRESQNELYLSNDNSVCSCPCSLYIIPELISFSVLLFYYQSQLFRREDVPDCLKLSGKENNVITKISMDNSWANALFADRWIDSLSDREYKWKTKVHVNPKGYGICIGIIDDKHEQNKSKSFQTQHACYYNNYNTTH